jgi:ribosomal protein S18 acetylase RimI-like enzyme
MAPALASLPPDPDRRLYRARAGGEVVCVLATLDHHELAPQQARGSVAPSGDLGVYFVATHPDHRGLGLARRLIGVARTQGRARGLETTSLQASPMGQPIYLRLGFGDHYAQTMWERRR